jgi:uncharacterized protein (TIGR02147 family)
LIRLELLEPHPTRKGAYRRTRGDLKAESPAPNQALRKYHRQLLERAIESLETQTPQEKLVQSQIVAMGTEQLKEADRLTEKYFAKISALAAASPKKTDIYHVGVQIFNLSKETKGKKS